MSGPAGVGDTPACQTHVPARPVHAAELFAGDPCRIFRSEGCGRDYGPPLSDVLQALPNKAFTHVLIVGNPQPLAQSARLRRVSHRGKGDLFEVVDGD
jgi:hypothetical protein